MAARQWRPQVRTAAALVAASVVVVVGFVVAAEVLDRSFRYFSKEPAETFDAPAYVGWLAHLTTLVWAAGAAAALVVGWALRTPFLLAGGALTGLMAADDAFLFHDGVYAKAGIPEEAVYAFYAVAATWVARRYWGEVVAADVVVAALAVAAWGVSLGSDFVQETTGRHLHVWEDGAKFVGVVLWTAFFVRAAVEAIRRRTTATGTAT